MHGDREVRRCSVEAQREAGAAPPWHQRPPRPIHTHLAANVAVQCLCAKGQPNHKAKRAEKNEEVWHHDHRPHLLHKERHVVPRHERQLERKKGAEERPEQVQRQGCENARNVGTLLKALWLDAIARRLQAL